MILPHLPCCQTGPTSPLKRSSVPLNGFFFIRFYWCSLSSIFGPFILIFKVLQRCCSLHKRHAQRLKNWEEYEILTYLHSSTLASHSLMGSGSRNETPGSKTKHNLSLRAAAVIRASVFVPLSQAQLPTAWHQRVKDTSPVAQCSGACSAGSPGFCAVK